MPAPVIEKLPRTALPLPMDAIAEFSRKWDLTEFALFGSILRPDDFGAGSDVDVMVKFSPDAKPTFFELVDMQDELEAMFGRSVDLLTRRGVEDMLNWYRRKAILDSAEVVYAR